MEVNNFDKLVKTVTKNILEKIDFKIDSKVLNKSCLVLIPNIGFGVKDYFEYITKNYPDYDLYLGSSEEFLKAHYLEESSNVNFINFDIYNSEFISLLEAVETIIVLGLKVSQMKSLIESDDKEDINHIILGGLMSNKSIDIMVNANGLMFNKIAEVVNDIRNMGINVTNIQQNENDSLDEVDLITEDYVMKLRENGLKVLIIDKKQLITPLAKDKLREYKIKLEVKKEDK